MRLDAKKHRQTLIAAAAKIFTQQGLDVPLQAILDATQLGRGTLYRHFPDREALIGAVIEHVYEQLSGFVTEWSGSPDILRRYLSYAAELRPSFTRMPDNVDVERVTQMAESVRWRFRILQQQVVDEATAAGMVPPTFLSEDLDLVIRMLVAAGDDANRSREDAVALAMDIILKGLQEQPHLSVLRDG